MICQVLNVVGKIMGFSDFVKELSLLVCFNVLNLSTSLLLCVQLLASFYMLLDLHLNDGHLLCTVLGLAFNFRVVQKPFGEEINRLFRLLFEHDSHALRNDLPQVLTLDVVGV